MHILARWLDITYKRSAIFIAHKSYRNLKKFCLGICNVQYTFLKLYRSEEMEEKLGGGGG